MKTIHLKKGLDVPITGAPKQIPRNGTAISTVALMGDDYIGMKPTMEVKEGEQVKTGQLLFTDKRNEGVKYTSPATGKIVSINRGEKRKFESLVIELQADEYISFLNPKKQTATSLTSTEITSILIDSGLWTSFIARPFGKTPDITSSPSALFITETDSRPLAPSPSVVIEQNPKDYEKGLEILEKFVNCPIYLCCTSQNVKVEIPEQIENVCFQGPHPSGLASTHIHFLRPATEKRTLWHIDYQDVIAIGHLFQTGQLKTDKIISLAGPGVLNPQLIKARNGANILELCKGELVTDPCRIISGSILDGRKVDTTQPFLGRYHNQVSVLREDSGRSLFNWVLPGSNRFSVKSIFISAFYKTRKFAMNTALWGGERAIFPVDSYDKVMPLDILPLPLLKAMSSGNTEKATNLGALELIEEDVALLSYVCPGKNDFGPLLRKTLTQIEKEG